MAHQGQKCISDKKCFWHTTQIKWNNLAMNIFRVKLSFHIITIIVWILQSLLFNSWSFLQYKLYFTGKKSNIQNTSYWLSLKNEPSITICWEGGQEAIPPHSGGRRLAESHGEMEKNDPSSLMAMRERESWQLSKQLSMQICSSESVTQAVSAALGR